MALAFLISSSIAFHFNELSLTSESSLKFVLLSIPRNKAQTPRYSPATSIDVYLFFFSDIAAIATLPMTPSKIKFTISKVAYKSPYSAHDTSATRTQKFLFFELPFLADLLFDRLQFSFGCRSDLGSFDVWCVLFRLR